MQGRNCFHTVMQLGVLCWDEAQVCKELDGMRKVPSAQQPAKSADHRLL